MARTIVGAISVVMVMLSGDSFAWLDSNHQVPERLQWKQQAPAIAQQTTAPTTQYTTTSTISLQEKFARVCKESRGTQLIERKAHGPIWAYSVTDHGVFRYSPTILEDVLATSEEAARTLLCVFIYSKTFEPCYYTNGSQIRRESLEAIIILVDIQSEEKVGQTTLPGSDPGCPYTIQRFRFDTLFGSDANPAKIFDWVQKHWSP